jgi:branched-subunit amino acid transport protein
MEVSWRVFAIITAAAFVTWVPRILPLVLLSRVQLPSVVLRWLQQIPVAIMAALLAQELFVVDGSLQWQPEKLLAAIPAFAIAYFTKSLLLAVVVGMLAMMLVKAFWTY